MKEKPPESRINQYESDKIKFESSVHIAGADRKFVYWLERRGRGVFMRASQYDVAGLLQDKYSTTFPVVVLTSATLSSGGISRLYVIVGPRCGGGSYS